MDSLRIYSKRGSLQWGISSHQLPPPSSPGLVLTTSAQRSPKKPSGKSLKLAARSHSPSSVLSGPGVSPGQPSKLRATAAFHLAALHALPPPPPGRIQVLAPSLSTDAGFSSTTDLLCDVGQPPSLSGPRFPHLTVGG